MALLLLSSSPLASQGGRWNAYVPLPVQRRRFGLMSISSSNNSLWHSSIAQDQVCGFKARAFFPNPTQEPILKEVLKEPVAFVGGVFAGLLRLDLKEEPLKEWVARTVEASGITVEEISKRGEEDDEETPQQIVIE